MRRLVYLRRDMGPSIQLNKLESLEHAFSFQIEKEILAAKREAEKLNKKLAIRLNVLSDIVWEKIIVRDDKNIFQLYPEIQFYDYTKIAKRFQKELPNNYHLTFSRAESNQVDVEMAAKLGGNIAVVFDKLPNYYLGKQVIDGDKNDLRFLDPKDSVVGLKAKGDAKKDKSGFVVRGES